MRGPSSPAAPVKKKAAGKQLGALTKSTDIVEQIRRLKGRGAINQAIARGLKMSPSTVVKYLLEA